MKVPAISAGHSPANPSTVKSGKPRRRAIANYRRKDLVGYGYIAPAFLVVGIFFFCPLGLLIWMSLHDWPLLGQPTFRGWDNFLALFSDHTFWESFWFTARYTIIVTPAIFLPAYVLALLVNSKLPGTNLFRTIYFLPVVIGLGTASLLWVWLLNDQVGPLNQFLVTFNLLREPALANGDTAFLAVVAMVVWKTVGFTMVLLLVGMQAIPPELYEAARIDGANWWKQQVRITFPLLRPTLALALLMSVVGSFLAFDQFYIMTGGGPHNSTVTIVYWIYRASFTYFKLGYGAAMSLVLMAGLTFLSACQFFFLRRTSD
ncbi:MAG: sugar ABC transporter permease [Verrucomicrobia bacterium]|nr:sugar ABC transporter permease [Verrucomicrobiota bacterium]